MLDQKAEEKALQDLARYSNPWSINILNHSSGNWEPFCHDAPITLKDAEERVKQYAQKDPEAAFAVVPWLNPSQQAVVDTVREVGKKKFDRLRRNIITALFETFAPEPSHEGSCGPESGCDGICLERSMLLDNIKKAIAKASKTE